MIDWTYDDGGRAAAGYQGTANDCVTRAIAIAAQLPYQQVYDLVNELSKRERPELATRRMGNKRSSARTGVYKATTNRVLSHLGWRKHPTMAIGQGCKVHLAAVELPPGRLIVQVSKHLVAVIDGVVHDTHDPSRDGTRCVYSYWTAS